MRSFGHNGDLKSLKNITMKLMKPIQMFLNLNAEPSTPVIYHIPHYTDNFFDKNKSWEGCSERTIAMQKQKIQEL